MHASHARTYEYMYCLVSFTSLEQEITFFIVVPVLVVVVVQLLRWTSLLHQTTVTSLRYFFENICYRVEITVTEVKKNLLRATEHNQVF